MPRTRNACRASTMSSARSRRSTRTSPTSTPTPCSPRPTAPTRRRCPSRAARSRACAAPTASTSRRKAATCSRRRCSNASTLRARSRSRRCRARSRRPSKPRGARPCPGRGGTRPRRRRSRRRAFPADNDWGLGRVEPSLVPVGSLPAVTAALPTVTAGAGACDGDRGGIVTVRLEAAAAAVDAAAELTTAAAEHLARGAAEDGRISVAKLDRHQVLAYDLAHAASALEGCRVMLDYGTHGELEGMLAGAFVADVVADVASRIVARDEIWGVSADALKPALDFVADRRSPEFLESIANRLPRHGTGPPHLSEDFELVRETFHRFAAEKVRPVAEHVHRANADIPEDVIGGLAEIGGFGLSVPAGYGGFAAGGAHDHPGIGGAPAELARGSLSGRRA